MAQPATNPKIEELRFRLKTDPKNRIFYPLAEELRKVGQFAEAEQVLRTGLTNHPTYLSAWVSLGRVLRELKNDGAAVEALNKALQLDPGNVVAARLLADAYLNMGEKVEAIKKYKLVHALLPADEEIEATIERLDREINPPAPAALQPEETAAAEESPFAAEPEAPQPVQSDAAAMPKSAEESPFAPEPEASPFAPPPQQVAPGPAAAEQEAPFAPPPPVFGDETATFPPGRAMPRSIQRMQQESAAQTETPFAPAAEPPSEMPAGPWATDEAQVFADAAQSMQQEIQVERATGDSEPMAAAHAESPFEEPAAYTADALEIESPQGVHVARAPLAAEVPVELPAAELPPPEAAPLATAAVPADEADIFAPAAEPMAGETREEPLPSAPAEDFTNTLTMADLYAKQGLVADARQIYENILLRDPDNAVVREKLAGLAAQPPSVMPASPHAESATEHDDKRVAKLEHWLSRVGKREAGSV